MFIDQKTNLATVFEVWTSSGIKQNAGRPNEFTLDDREVQRQIYFGYVDSEQKVPFCGAYVSKCLGFRKNPLCSCPSEILFSLLRFPTKAINTEANPHIKQKS